jgi:hypothetical protein
VVTTRPPLELLYDSEASLRLVDNAIGELGADVDIVTMDDAGAPPTSLAPADGAITRILARLRASRDQLEQGAAAKLHLMQQTPSAVSSASERATDILDGLERATMLVDELDLLADDPASGVRAAAVRSHMRKELFGLAMHLQLHDATAQQLAYASSVIAETERRLTQMATMLEPPAADEIIR